MSRVYPHEIQRRGWHIKDRLEKLEEMLFSRDEELSKKVPPILKLLSDLQEEIDSRVKKSGNASYRKAHG